MTDLDLDWYTYLTEDFKLDRSVYRSAHKVVVDCPRCGQTQVVRLGHLKAKIKKLKRYECSRCRKADSLVKARAVFKEKYGVSNPFQLESVKESIKQTNIARYGVSHVAVLPKIQKVGQFAAKKRRDEERDYDVDYANEISADLATDRKAWMREYNQLRYAKDPTYRERRNAYFTAYNKKRREADPAYRATCMVYNALNRMLQGQDISKTNILKNIGYTPADLRRHIESLFQPGMTWENHGKWHLDHIKPLSLFDCTDLEQVYAANQLDNLQPLWALDNIKKSNKY